MPNGCSRPASQSINSSINPLTPHTPIHHYTHIPRRDAAHPARLDPRGVHARGLACVRRQLPARLPHQDADRGALPSHHTIPRVRRGCGGWVFVVVGVLTWMLGASSPVYLKSIPISHTPKQPTHEPNRLRSWSGGRTWGPRAASPTSSACSSTPSPTTPASYGACVHAGGRACVSWGELTLGGADV